MSDAESSPTQQIDISPPMQRHIVATMLRAPGVMLRVRAIVDPDYFSDQAVADCVAWLLGHWDQYKSLPSKEALLDAFKLQPEIRSLVKEMFVEPLPDIDYTVHRIIAFAQNRALRSAVVQAAGVVAAQARGDVLRDDRNKPLYADPDSYIRQLVDKAIMVGKTASDLGEDVAANLEAGIEQLLNPAELERFTTGSTDLDNAGCAIERSEIGCVLARAKAGKSHMLLNIAAGNLRLGRNVVYYNLEIKDERFRQRIYRRVAGKMVDMKVDPAAFVKKLRERFPKQILGKLLVKRYPARTATIDDLRSHLSRVCAEHFKPDLVIVDYLGIMKPRLEYEQVRFNLESNWLDFRSLCQEFNVAGWSAAQSNRQGAGNELVTMTDFGECYAIVQHIDVGFSINMTQAEYDAGKGRFFVLASRNEQDGALIPFEFDYSRSLIKTAGVTTSTEGARSAPPEAESRRSGQ